MSEDLLNKTFYAWNEQGLLSDILDFIQFSEANIECQWRRELQSLELRSKGSELDEEYIAHLKENINSRFGLTLTQRLRYAVLCAIVTTIEWTAVIYSRKAVPPIPPNPKSQRSDDLIHILTEFNNRGALGLEAKINVLQKLVYVRNCVTHNAGLLDGYKHQNELPDVLNALEGFSLSDNPWVGPGVEINKGVLDRYIHEMLDWIPKFVEACAKRGLIQL